MSEADLQSRQNIRARIENVGHGSGGYYLFVFNNYGAAYLPKSFLAYEEVMSLQNVPLALLVDNSPDRLSYGGLGQIVDIKIKGITVLSVEDVKSIRRGEALEACFRGLILYLVLAFGFVMSIVLNETNNRAGKGSRKTGENHVDTIKVDAVKNKHAAQPSPRTTNKKRSKLTPVIWAICLIAINVGIGYYITTELLRDIRTDESYLVEMTTTCNWVEQVHGGRSSYYFILGFGDGTEAWLGKSHMSDDEVMRIAGKRVEVVIDTSPDNLKRGVYQLVSMKWNGTSLLSYEEILKYRQHGRMTGVICVVVFYFIISPVPIYNIWDYFRQLREEKSTYSGFDV